MDQPRWPAEMAAMFNRMDDTTVARRIVRDSGSGASGGGGGNGSFNSQQLNFFMIKDEIKTAIEVAVTAFLKQDDRGNPIASIDSMDLLDSDHAILFSRVDLSVQFFV